MSSLVWKIHTKTGMKYRVRETEQGEEIYQIDDERSRWVSKTYFERVVESRAMPRDHDRHEPHNIPEYRNFSASAESTAHLGPLQAPGPRDNRLFPEERHPGEGHTQDRYEIRPGDGSTSAETATSRRRESFREPYRGPIRNIDPGAASNLNFQDRSSGGVSEPAAPAPPPHLSALARIFVGMGLDYPRSLDFILDNPLILQKSQSDDLMTAASAAEKAGQSTTAKACIHQALLLRECREVGQDRVGSFFRKLTSKDGKEKEAFLRKVGTTYKAVQEQGRKTVQQNPDVTSESSGRKMPVIAQERGQTTSHNTSGYLQTPVGPTQLETPKIRDIDGQRYYTDNRGNILRPVSSRRDTDRQRADSDPAEVIERMAAVRIEGTQGATSLASSRGNSSARDYPLQQVTSTPTAPLSVADENPQPGPNRPGSNDRSPQKLDERYIIRKDAKKFFVRGRVFAVLWPEPVGNGGGRGSRRGNTLPSGDPVETGNTMYGEPVFTHIRRMVVVREDHGSCLCLGISTYSRQGVTKFGLNDDDRRAHSIIHMIGQAPYCTPEEQRYLKKKAIAVKPSSADQKLGDMSRLNYKKVYTAEHNYKVMSVGQVTHESLAALLGYWRNTMFPPEKPQYGSA